MVRIRNDYLCLCLISAIVTKDRHMRHRSISRVLMLVALHQASSYYLRPDTMCRLRVCFAWVIQPEDNSLSDFFSVIPRHCCNTVDYS